MSGARGLVGAEELVLQMAVGLQLVLHEFGEVDGESRFSATIFQGAWPNGSALSHNTFKASEACISVHPKPVLYLRGVSHKLPLFELMRAGDALRLEFPALLADNQQVPA